MKSLMNMPKIRLNKTYGQIFGEHYREDIFPILAEKERKFAEKHSTYIKIKKFRKKQKASNSGLISFIAKAAVDTVVKNVTKRITQVVDIAKTATKVRMGQSQFGRNVLNGATRTSQGVTTFASETMSEAKNIANSVGKVVSKPIGVIKGGVNVVGKAFRFGFDALDAVGKVGDSIGKSALPSLGIYVLTGGSLPVALAYGGISVISKTTLSLLRDSRISSVPGISHLQKSFGVGQYYDIQGRLKYDMLNPNYESSLYRRLFQDVQSGKITELQFSSKIAGEVSKIEAIDSKLVAGRPLMGRFYSVLSKLDALTTWGTIGGAIGTVLAPILGISPIIGAAGLGLASGAAGIGVRTVIDNTKYGQTALQALRDSSLLKNGFIRSISQIPLMSLVDLYGIDLWWAQQLDLIKNRYHGNFGAYLRDHWNLLDNPSFLKTVSVFGNLLMAGSTAFSLMNPLIGNFALRIANSMFVKGIALSARAVGAANLVGTLAGTAIAMALGVPIGPAMLAGAVIGGLAGTVIGVGLSTALSLGTGGLAFFFTAGVTAVTSAIGSWIGSLFDKAVGLSGGLFMNFINGMMAIFQMLTLLQQRITLENSMSIALSLVALLSTVYKMGILEKSNQCVDKDKCPNTSQSTGINQPNLTNLSAYNVSIIQNSQQAIKPIDLENLTNYLAQNSDRLSSEFSNKRIYINFFNTNNFVSEDFVIIGLGGENPNTSDYKSFQELFNLALTNLGDTTTSQLPQNEVMFLKLAN